MGIQIASSKIVQRTDTGTDDLTVSGFGTIGSGGLEGAAMFLTTFSDAAAGVGDGHAVLSVGFTDGTNTYAMSASSANNKTSTISKKRQTVASSHVMLRNAPNTGNIRSSAYFDSWITNGVRINVDDLDGAGKYVQAILLASDHANAEFEVGYFDAADTDGGTVSPGSMSGQADMVICCSIQRDTFDANDANCIISIGIWVNNGSDEQGSVNFAELDNQADGDPFGFLDTNYVVSILGASNELAGISLSSHSAGFTATTNERNSSAAGCRIAYLACRFGHKIKAKVGDYAVPTLTGTPSQTGVGFRPKWLFGMLSHLSALDTWLNNDTAETVGFGFHDGTTSHAMSMGVEHLTSGNTDCGSLHDDEFHSTHAMNDGGYQVGTPSAWSDDGWTWNWSTSGLSTAGKSLYVAITQLNDGTIDGDMPTFSGDLTGEVPRSGDIDGVIPAFDGDLSGTVTDPTVSGTIDGEIPTLQGSVTGIVPRGGTIDGAIPSLDGSVTGIVVRSGSVDGTVPVIEGSLSGSVADPVWSGTIDGVIPTLEGSVVGIVEREGIVTGSLPAFEGSLSGSVSDPVRTGTIDGVLSTPDGSILGIVEREGTIDGAISTPDGSLTGIVPREGAIDGSMPTIDGSLPGIVEREGAIDGTMPVIDGDLAGNLGDPVYSGTIDGEIPAFDGSISGEVLREGTIDGVLPVIEGDLSGSVTNPLVSGTIDGEIPAFSGDLTGIVPREGTMDGVIPVIEGSLSGTVTTGDVTGTIDGVIPQLIGSLTGTFVGTVTIGPKDPKAPWRPRFSDDARSQPRFRRWLTVEEQAMLQAGLQIPSVFKPFTDAEIAASIHEPSVKTTFLEAEFEAAFATPEVTVGWRTN